MRTCLKKKEKKIASHFIWNHQGRNDVISRWIGGPFLDSALVTVPKGARTGTSGGKSRDLLVPQPQES